MLDYRPLKGSHQFRDVRPGTVLTSLLIRPPPGLRSQFVNLGFEKYLSHPPLPFVLHPSHPPLPSALRPSVRSPLLLTFSSQTL
jgi:hypothetical protein